MKSLFNKILLGAVVFSAVSCFQKRGRNYQYFPDMYYPVSYEAYGSSEIFKNDQEAQLPAKGSIPRGWKPYEYDDTNDGYDEAKADLKNPLPYTEENVKNGKALYGLYCGVCHGDKGDGKGILATREKILGIPAYNDPGRNITEGSVYHVIYFGRNNMGSYAAQTNERERWQIDHYVMDLKRKLDGLPERDFVEATPEQKMETRRENVPVEAQYKIHLKEK